MEKYCEKCGFPLSEGQRFCPGCGSPLQSRAGDPEDVSAQTSMTEPEPSACSSTVEAFAEQTAPQQDALSDETAPAYDRYAVPAAPIELQRKKKPSSRRRTFLIVFAAALTVLALAIGLTVYFYGHRLSPEEEVILGRWNAAGAVMDGSFYTLDEGSVALNVEKDHTAVLHIANDNRLSWEYLKAAGGELYYTVSPGSGICYLPDSDELILIVNNDYVIFLER